MRTFTPTELAASQGTRSRCLVCGFAELRTDLVLDRGWVLLSECPRCEHRATRAVSVSEPAVRTVHRVRGIASEATEAA